MPQRRCHAPGCTKPAKRKWCSEVCRKKTEYGGTCDKCGGDTNGSAGPGRAAKLCKTCSGGRRRWDQESIKIAMLDWNLNYGEPPTSTQWGKTDGGVHPTASTVINIFGSWNTAMEYAGFEPRKIGQYPRIHQARPKPAPEPRRPRARSVPVPARRRVMVLEPAASDDEDYSTNTPDQNRKMVARMNAGRKGK